MCENWFILFICDANAKNLKLHCGTWKNRKTGRNWQQMTSCGFDCGLVCWLLNVGLGTVLDWDTTLHNMGHCDNWTFWDATFPSNGKVWIKLGNTYPFIMFFNFLPWRFDTVRWGRVLAKYDLIDFPFLFFFWANWSQLMGNMNININMANNRISDLCAQLNNCKMLVFVKSWVTCAFRYLHLFIFVLGQ